MTILKRLFVCVYYVTHGIRTLIQHKKTNKQNMNKKERREKHASICFSVSFFDVLCVSMFDKWAVVAGGCAVHPISLFSLCRHQFCYRCFFLLFRSLFKLCFSIAVDKWKISKNREEKWNSTRHTPKCVYLMTNFKMHEFNVYTSKKNHPHAQAHGTEAKKNAQNIFFCVPTEHDFFAV